MLSQLQSSRPSGPHAQAVHMHGRGRLLCSDRSTKPHLHRSMRAIATASLRALLGPITGFVGIEFVVCARLRLNEALLPRLSKHGNWPCGRSIEQGTHSLVWSSPWGTRHNLIVEACRRGVTRSRFASTVELQLGRLPSRLGCGRPARQRPAPSRNAPTNKLSPTQVSAAPAPLPWPPLHAAAQPVSTTYPAMAAHAPSHGSQISPPVTYAPAVSASGCALSDALASNAGRELGPASAGPRAEVPEAAA